MPEAADELKSLQAQLYREEILRARQLTREQRMAEVFEISDRQIGMMLSGAMHKLQTRDENEGWQEVSRWIKRLEKAHDRDFYTAEAPDEK